MRGNVYGRVIVGLVLLAAVTAFGTIGYIVIEGWPFLDALYMTVTAVTTVGFREVHPLDTAGIVFTIGLLLVGVGVAFYILTAMVATIIEGELVAQFGRRRMRVNIEHLKDHYIVCGYGRVGEEVAGELTDRHTEFIIVDRDQAVLDQARRAGLIILQGDATEESTLVAAGVTRARALIAATDSDATNTFITLTARGLNDGVFVVARISTPAVEGKLRQAGANRTVSPYTIGGRRMAFAALQPIMTDFIDVDPGDQENDRIIAEFVIDEASELAGREVAQALAGCGNVIVLALRAGDGRFSVGPAQSTRLALHDRLVVVGTEEELRSLGAVVRVNANA